MFNSPQVVSMEKGDGAAGIPPPHSTPKNNHGDHPPHINSLNPGQQFQVSPICMSEASRSLINFLPPVEQCVHCVRHLACYLFVYDLGSSRLFIRVLFRRFPYVSFNAGYFHPCWLLSSPLSFCSFFLPRTLFPLCTIPCKYLKERWSRFYAKYFEFESIFERLPRCRWSRRFQNFRRAFRRFRRISTHQTRRTRCSANTLRYPTEWWRIRS